MDFPADAVRGVVFLDPTHTQQDSRAVWAILFPGDDPDAYQRATGGLTLNSTASGAREGFGTSINVQIGRIDLILSRDVSTDDMNLQVGPPRIPDVPAATRQLANLLKRVFERLPVIRIAIILDLAENVSVSNQHAIMASELDRLKLPAEATDVSFQFNIRKISERVPSIPINRLCAWMSGMTGFFIGQPGQPITSQSQMIPFVGMKIDVNSAPEIRLTSDQAKVLIDELVEEGLAIRTEGIKKFIP